MKKSVISCIVGLIFISTSSYGSGDDEHKDWIPILSIDTGVTRHAQTQINKMGKTDTSTTAGKKAKRLINQGKIMQNRLRTAKDKPLSKREANDLKVLIKQMDQTAKPGKGSQGACFKSCDKAYGSGFGSGKGWNRFWCKASCFDIKVNVGGVGDKNPKPGIATKSSTPGRAKK